MELEQLQELIEKDYRCEHYPVQKDGCTYHYVNQEDAMYLVNDVFREIGLPAVEPKAFMTHLMEKRTLFSGIDMKGFRKIESRKLAVIAYILGPQLAVN